MEETKGTSEKEQCKSAKISGSQWAKDCKHSRVLEEEIWKDRKQCWKSITNGLQTK